MVFFEPKMQLEDVIPVRSSQEVSAIIFIHHQCWEVLPFCLFQRQRCIKIRVLRAQDFYTPLALKTAKGQHLPGLVVYKNQSPKLQLLSTQIYRKVCVGITFQKYYICILICP